MLDDILDFSLFFVYRTIKIKKTKKLNKGFILSYFVKTPFQLTIKLLKRFVTCEKKKHSKIVRKQ